MGFEALIRWQHPQRGLLTPDAFIEFAEETGLIKRIGHWVLETACKQARKWLNSGYDFGVISVNVAGKQIDDDALYQQVKQCLHDSALDAGYIKLELTESLIMHKAETSIDQLNKIRSLGIQLAIDDFGTGYSSLSYLKQLPIQTLKVDKSFIHGIPRDENDIAIVEAIIIIADKLGLDVIAEGVEEKHQLEHLRQMGCKQIQGYLFGKPMPVAEAELNYFNALNAQPEK